jgi:hypothetical protein
MIWTLLLLTGESPKSGGGSTELCGIGIQVVMHGFTGELMSNSVQILTGSAQQRRGERV